MSYLTMDELQDKVQQFVESQLELKVTHWWGTSYANAVIDDTLAVEGSASLDDSKYRRLSWVSNQKGDWIRIFLTGHGEYGQTRKDRKIIIENDVIVEDRNLKREPFLKTSKNPKN